MAPPEVEMMGAHGERRGGYCALVVYSYKPLGTRIVEIVVVDGGPSVLVSSLLISRIDKPEKALEEPRYGIDCYLVVY